MGGSLVGRLLNAILFTDDSLNISFLTAEANYFPIGKHSLKPSRINQLIYMYLNTTTKVKVE